MLQWYGSRGSRMAVFPVQCCMHLCIFQFPVNAWSRLKVHGDYTSVDVWWVLRKTSVLLFSIRQSCRVEKSCVVCINVPI